MVEPPSKDSIVVLLASVTHEDPGEIVGANVWFVNSLLDEYLTPEEISTDALRSYYVDYYLAQVNNGGFSQFVYNARWSPAVVRYVREGLQAMGAQRHRQVFEEGSKLVEEFGRDRLERYFASEYFGENPDRDALNALNDRFCEADQTEDLLALNAAWLRSRPHLYPMPTEEAMLQESRRRGQAIPDREQRIAAARANEPRYMKLIRVLCERAGHQLERVTGGDPARVHEGSRVLAWHFLTDQGHHHMIEFDGKAIMFRGHSVTERICEVDVPVD